MCGSIVVTIGSAATSWPDNLARQCLYSIGRVCSYTCLGAIAGFVGLWTSQSSLSVLHVQSLLAIIAGLFLITQGLVSAGILRVRAVSGPLANCQASRFFGEMLRGDGRLQSFVAGVMTSLLPCGLLYGFLLLAASTGHLVAGALVMAVFSLGTVPAMLLTGCSGSLLRLTLRRLLMNVAAWCLILTGALTLARGLASRFSPEAERPACPWCLLLD